MARLVTLFHPKPTPAELPERFPSPFDELGPHPLARQAAEALASDLRAGLVDLGAEGKMFGVLVVQTKEGVGFLRAFSGMLAGKWDVPGFVPPVFDRKARASVEVDGERRVSALHARVLRFARSGRLARARAERDALAAEHAQALAALKARQALHKAERKKEREVVRAANLSDEARAQALHRIDQESRRDKAELRSLTASHAAARAGIAAVQRKLERRLAALERLRGCASRRLMRTVHDTYRVANARGDLCPLRTLYPLQAPPSGAADCAGPKLLATAFAQGWTPLALAELWWGPPPATGARVQGEYYPACQEKCGPLLPFMLRGLDVEPPRRFRPPDLREAPLRVVFEDAWLLVIDKPCGLLSVPGKDASVADSVLERLRRLFPGATGPLLVHRLDLDTSGLLVACKDSGTFVALQRQFLQRTVQKRYLAVLEGEVNGERGTIELPLRVDLHDRPRQIHDPVHGKPAVTDWEVLERGGGRTRVALWPRTGRTHQLRVHAAHPQGLGAPIVGDRIYGREGERLLLHAAWISFNHPASGARVSFEAPPPF